MKILKTFIPASLISNFTNSYKKVHRYYIKSLRTMSLIMTQYSKNKDFAIRVLCNKQIKIIFRENELLAFTLFL